MVKIFVITFLSICNITAYKRVSSKISIKGFVSLLLFSVTLFIISFFSSKLIMDSNPEIGLYLSHIAESSFFSIAYLVLYLFMFSFYNHLNEFSTINLVNFSWVAKMMGLIFLFIVFIIQISILFDYGFWEYIQNLSKH